MLCKTRQSDSFSDFMERLVSDPTNARSWDRGTSTLNNCRIARILSITEIFSPKVSWQLEVFVLRKKKLGISCTLKGGLHLLRWGIFNHDYMVNNSKMSGRPVFLNIARSV